MDVLDILILRDDLDLDVRVIRMSQTLELGVDHLIGKLWRFWREAKRHATPEGHLVGYSADRINETVRWHGFAEALVQVGWLKLTPVGATIPHFEEWISPEAMKALLKRAVAPSCSHPGFDAFWAKYPRKEGKQKARAAWDKLRPTGELLGKVMDGLDRWNRSAQWSREGIIPHASTWLNGWRWEDEIDDRRGVGQAGRVVAQPGKYAGYGPGGEGGPAAADG
jgi:hypothetical protein